MTDTIPKVKPSKIEEPAAWYAGTGEEYMNIGGPYKTREEAIAEGRHDRCGDPFYICNAARTCEYVIERGDHLAALKDRT